MFLFLKTLHHLQSIIEGVKTTVLFNYLCINEVKTDSLSVSDRKETTNSDCNKEER